MNSRGRKKRARNNNRTTKRNSQVGPLRRLTQDQRKAGGPMAVAYRTRGMVSPDVVFEQMVYNYPVTISNVGVSYTNNRFCPNSIYDVDPLVGSVAVAGLTEMAAIYSGARVISYKYKIEISNNEAFPVNAFCIAFMSPGTDPGANTIKSVDYPMNEGAKSRLLSAKGGQDRCVFSGTVNLNRYMSNQVLGDDSFASSTSAAVAAGYRCYFVIGALAGSTVFTAAGVTVKPEFTLNTMFFNKVELLT